MNTPTNPDGRFPMSTNDTPRTDAAENGTPFETDLTRFKRVRNCSRKLERELAALRAEVERLRDGTGSVTAHIWNECVTERDRLRAEVARLTAIGPVSGSSVADVYQWLRDCQQENAELRKALDGALTSMNPPFDWEKFKEWSAMIGIRTRELAVSAPSDIDAAIDAAKEKST